MSATVLWLGRGMMLAACFFLFFSCATREVRVPENAGQRYEFNQPQMGVPFRIVLYATNEARARLAARDAFRRVSELNDRLSDYDADSELRVFCQTAGSGQRVPLGDDLWRVLERAQYFARESDGAFDVTVGPCVNLWRRARRDQRMPDGDRLARAREAMGYTNLVLEASGRTGLLRQPEMRLDLGGIAKGYAADEALRVLRSHGIRRALVAGAGDMVVGAPPPGKKGWRVEMAPLDAKGAPAARFLLLANEALATSGDVFQHVVIDGRRYSHIVDPRTGVGLTDHSLVTVVAKDGATADALSTSVSVAGPVAGKRLMARMPGASCRLVRLVGDAIEVYESHGFGRHYE